VAVEDGLTSDGTCVQTDVKASNRLVV